MMIVDETIQKLTELKLTTMAQAFRQMLDSADHQQLSFEDKFGMLVDREWIDRDNRRNLKAAIATFVTLGTANQQSV